MANEKFLKGRFQQKSDTKENWEKAKNFIPLDGEIIVYKDIKKLKVGDGVTTVGNLEFYTGEIDEKIFEDYVKNDTLEDTKEFLSQGRSAKYSLTTPGWKRVLNIIRATDGVLTFGIAQTAPYRMVQNLCLDISGFVKFILDKSTDNGPVIIQRYNNIFGEDRAKNEAVQTRITKVRVGYPKPGTKFPIPDTEGNYQSVENYVNCYVDVYIDFDPTLVNNEVTPPLPVTRSLNMNFAGFSYSHNCVAIEEETDAVDVGIYGEELEYQIFEVNDVVDTYMPGRKFQSEEVIAELVAATAATITNATIANLIASYIKGTRLELGVNVEAIANAVAMGAWDSASKRKLLANAYAAAAFNQGNQTEATASFVVNYCNTILKAASYSFVAGQSNTAAKPNQFIAGYKNAGDEISCQTKFGKWGAPAPKALFAVGCGTSENNRRNGLAVLETGEVDLCGGKIISTVGEEKEWVNPPMQLGVEYRTTERWKGKPVYVKAVDIGALSGAVNANITLVHGCATELVYGELRVGNTVDTAGGKVYAGNPADVRYEWQVNHGGYKHINLNITIMSNSQSYSTGYAVVKYIK